MSRQSSEDQSPVAERPQAGRDVSVHASGLTKSYGAEHSRVHALRGVSLDVGRGEKVALLGKSGSGKSTLLNLIGGLDRPTAGNLVVNGSDLARMSPDALARYRLRTVGMVFQACNLIASRSALENVELPMVFAGRAVRERREVATRVLESVGLGHRLTHRPAELSGGELQRAAIARAIVNDPEVLLADEPTGNLDSSTAAEVIEVLMGHVGRSGATLIVVTHDEELASRCADRVFRMRDGQLVE